MVKKKTDKLYYEAVGRRRTAVARVRLYIADGKGEHAVGKLKVKKGDMIIDEVEFTTHFPHAYQKVAYEKPLILAECLGRFAVVVKTTGGGTESRLDAVILGISRALLKVDESYRAALKAEGLLTRDARERERRKVGTGGRARRKKQSPKR